MPPQQVSSPQPTTIATSPNSPQPPVQPHPPPWPGTLRAPCPPHPPSVSLACPGFRGFRGCGIIGGVGLLVCWALTVALLPATTAAWESVRPLRLTSHASPAPYGQRMRELLPAAQAEQKA